MLYVLDTSSFIVMSHFFPDRFPTYWVDIDRLVAEGSLVSVSEVAKELDNQSTRAHLGRWVKRNRSLFGSPTPDETTAVARIFSVPRFQGLLKRKDILEGRPVADPWVIARAMTRGGTVITEESARAGMLRIPQVCTHFKIPCTNVEGLMLAEGLEY